MPIPPLIPAIISSIIESAADEAATAPVIPQAQWPAVGQMRTLPAESKRGRLDSAAMGVVHIDGREMPLSPAAQIRNEMNMLIVPTMVTQAAPVRYVVDGMGYVSRIWILTPAELAASN